MEREALKSNDLLRQELYNRAQKRKLADGGFCEAMVEYGMYPYGRDSFQKLWEQMERFFGKDPRRISTAEEFWNPAMKKALIYMTDARTLAAMEEMTHMEMSCQFSKSACRRSYRSSEFGYHAAAVIRELCGWIKFQTYEKSVKEALYFQHEWVSGYDMLLALELHRGNEEIIALIEEAILGDNRELLLTSTMIRAIIISGQESLLELLLRLLVAAKLQEGLRQQILEQADAGSMDTMTRILKVCIDEDLFRYSSAIRALDTWTGLGYSDAKPALAGKCAVLAWECLTEPEKRRKYLESADTLEAYFALWSTGCEEAGRVDALVQELLLAPEKYRRVLGWLFISRMDNAGFQMRIAEGHLEEKDPELLAWITGNLVHTWKLQNNYYYYPEDKKLQGRVPQANADLPDQPEARRALFKKLWEVALLIGNKQQTFTGNPFPFSSITLDVAPVIKCMISLAGYDMDETLIEGLMTLLPLMDVSGRQAVYANLVDGREVEHHKEYLKEALGDRSVQVKELAVKKLSVCRLNEADLVTLGEGLKSKSSGLRKSILSVFQSQSVDRLSGVIAALLSSVEEYQIQAGIELLLGIREAHPDELEKHRESLASLREKKLSTQTEILLQQLDENVKNGEESFTEENGYGLYDDKVIAENLEKIKCGELQVFADDGGTGRRTEEFLDASKENPQKKAGFLGKLLRVTGQKSEATAAKDRLYSRKELQKLLNPSKEEVLSVLKQMNEVYVRHADYEYEAGNYDGSREKVLFGNQTFLRYPAELMTDRGAWKNPNLSMVPFHEEFLEAMGDYGKNLQKLLGICYVTAAAGFYQRTRAVQTEGWFESLEKQMDIGYHQEAYAIYGTRYWTMRDIMQLVLKQWDHRELFSEALKIYESMTALVGVENLHRNCRKPDAKNTYGAAVTAYPINTKLLGYWREIIHIGELSDEELILWFTLEYPLEQGAKAEVSNGLMRLEMFRARKLGLIPEDAITKRFLTGMTRQTDIRMLTNPNCQAQTKLIYEACPGAKELVHRCVQRIVEVEEQRGELGTALTDAAVNIERFEGAAHFVHLLAALGKENFFRGYMYSTDKTKKAVLSRLLKRCYPGKTDTVEGLKRLLRETDISDRRLAEAAVYAPQWAAFAEEILQWPGLKCGIWFFHAHINETFSAEKETEVALYSPITPQQFNDGAFDKQWFFEAYEKLGEKRFQILYKSAKYITSGSNQHRRSQLYTDAVLGRLDAGLLKAEIIEKRNQEKLRCYPLIPIAEGESKEALHRYEFIQKFLKESRQFGAQRRESEKKACSTALENLAITMGFGDVNRMTWYLESEKLEEIRPFMEPKTVGGTEIQIAIDEDGVAELKLSKNGKAQKSVPKALNKDETILLYKETVRELKEQRSRGRVSLERSMVNSTEFGVEELEKILSNPVLSPMLQKLVWTDGTAIGFVEADVSAKENIALKELNESRRFLPADAKLRIAHPHDLKDAGIWSDYMHLLYERKIKQPFKQVFREYYPMTEEELREKNVSRRYAGYQVQPQKTVALLKGCGWTVDYEEGLQKVFYKENLIVRMYALADWFSPADIEAPTLEVIRFYDRGTGECVDFKKVPAILFSETMRDLDLVVSVAYVGGVDPEASHSTVEMRTALAEEVVKLLRLGNVSLTGTHARIRGSLGNYSVHLGSGIVHEEGVGALAILPVHSQARGRIFLPFADDDPKTAEIISKIVLLAEDQKIKDPSILRQI